MEEKKKLAFAFVDGKAVLTVDSDMDGKPVLELKLDLSEVLDEIVAAIKNRKKEPEAGA